MKKSEVEELRRRRVERKRFNLGILLGVLGGSVAVLESSIVLAYSSGSYGLVGLVVAILIIAGSVIVYKGHRLVGAMIMFFPSLIGQLTGGGIGWVIVFIIAPPPPPWFSDRFVVTNWTLFGLVGSILILFAIWRSKRR